MWWTASRLHCHMEWVQNGMGWDSIGSTSCFTDTEIQIQPQIHAEIAEVTDTGTLCIACKRFDGKYVNHTSRVFFFSSRNLFHYNFVIYTFGLHFWALLVNCTLFLCLGTTASRVFCFCRWIAQVRDVYVCFSVCA